MHTVPLKLVTIVAEPVLEERIVTMLRELGATGWTVTPCRGEGSRHIRASDPPGDGVRIETIVSAEAADRALERVAQDFFAHYAVIAWVGDVAVVRGDKYVRGDG
jgi:nitrogen regulatory protein PII